MIGTRLGPYEIVALLGAGGMGEVYRARDTRLHRDVAIKILPAEVADDPDRRARFEREARAVAALSHPNILAIFDVGVAERVTYVVTELLDGQSLRERLAAGPLAPRKAIDIGVQIAHGLAAAHEKGIVHRDIKPENVFVLADGRAKILDFGLARTTTDAAAETETRGTDPGVVMGTVGYMAPEQVRGQAIDARTDLFALGAVLHEMLSGRRAFQRETTADTMSAILREDPPELTTTRPDISPAIGRIIGHCLEKQPAERFQSARDVAFALAALSESGSAPLRVGEGEPSADRRQTRRWIRPVAAGIAVGTALTASMFAGLRLMTGPPPQPRYTLKTFEPQTIFGARFLPDGSTIAYTRLVGNKAHVVLARPDSRTPEPISGPNTMLLSVSKSGELAVLTDVAMDQVVMITGTLARMAIGGAPRPIRERVRTADWGPDGTSLAVVQAAGGRDRLEYPLGTVLYETSGAIAAIRVSPDGESVAFSDNPLRGDDRGWIKVVDRAGHVRTLAGEHESQQGLAWTPDGVSVVFSAYIGGAQPFWARTVMSAPASGRRSSGVVLETPGGLMAEDVSARGDLLATRTDLVARIMVQVPGAASERDLSWQTESIFPILSANGGFVVFHYIGQRASYDIALRKTDGSPAFRVGEGVPLAVSPDGTQVLALTVSPNQAVIYPTGPGERKTLPKGAIETYLPAGAWFPDGRRVLTCGNEAGRPPRCYEQSLDGVPKAVTPEGVVSAALSPDGRRLLAKDVAGAWQVVELSNGAMEAARGLEAADLVAGWSRDASAAFASRIIEVPSRLDRVDLRTGTRTRLRELAPPDRTGVISISLNSVIDDARGYAYWYTRNLGTIYLVEGMNLAGR
jgi:serine/threonine protein kinase